MDQGLVLDGHDSTDLGKRVCDWLAASSSEKRLLRLTYFLDNLIPGENLECPQASALVDHLNRDLLLP
jgi:hypothetical protein